MFIIINILLLVKIQISAVIKMTPQVLRSLIINLIISSYKYIMLLSVCTRFNHGIKIHSSWLLSHKSYQDNFALSKNRIKIFILIILINLN